MKRFKKILKLLVLVCLIVLAGLGVGLGGGAILPSSNKKRKTTEFKIELIELKEEDSKLKKDDLTVKN